MNQFLYFGPRSAFSRPPWGRLATLIALMLAVAACGSQPTSSTSSAPVKVGMVYSQTGILAAYGAEFRQGFDVGLAYATHGTDSVDGRRIQVSWADDAGDPSKGTLAAKTFIGDGYRILAGTTDSAVADALATLAAQNHVLYIAGDAADDSLTGANRWTFRAGRQTAQDVLTARSFLPSGGGGTMLVFAQDYAFGTSYVQDAQHLLAPLGYQVSDLLVPLSATDFTPFALRARQAHPDVLFVAWAGTTTGAMWTAMAQQGVLSSTRVVTGLAQRSTYDAFGAATPDIDLLSLYFYQCCHNAANDYLINALKKQGTVPDLFDPDGFVTAQMIVHAVAQAHGDDVNAMIKALEGWSFLAPKGEQTIRASDHAMLQPMFQARLVRSSGGYEPVLIKALTAQQTAPPAVAMGQAS
jgi:branched-chain amino acid transport system substrate-binding protein